MKITFAEEFETIHANLVRMGDLANDTLRGAIAALRDKDVELARKIINQDDVIDNYLIVIEEEVSRLISIGSRTTKDLRMALGVLKTAQDLERVGDYAANIAELALELKNQEYIKPLVHIPQMSSLAVSMLESAVKAFVQNDIDLAEAVCKRDDEVDELYHEIDHELTDLLTKPQDKKETFQATRFLLLSKDLERVADHATNIGEQTIFVNTGNRVHF